MRDPFPPPPALLIRLTKPLASRLSLNTLPQHTHEILLSFLLYHAINVSISPRLSAYLFPTIYPRLRPRTKVSWDAHVVSLVQSCIINTLAVVVLVLDHERKIMTPRERLWGYTGASGMVQGFAAGYFVWDLWTGIMDFDVHGWGTVIHAVCALAVSMLGFRPFLNYHGINFVLYELSTPFLNIHWFMDKLHKTGSRAQWINGLALLTSFAASRLLWGSYQTFRLIQDVWLALRGFDDSLGEKGVVGQRGKAEGEGGRGGDLDLLPVPRWLAVLYVISMVALGVLNVRWFWKMVGAVRSRFEGGKGGVVENGKGGVVENGKGGVVENGKGGFVENGKGGVVENGIEKGRKRDEKEKET